jgi:hypothetical protein
MSFQNERTQERLKISNVKTHQNQNGTRQRRHVRHRRVAFLT